MSAVSAGGEGARRCGLSRRGSSLVITLRAGFGLCAVLLWCPLGAAAEPLLARYLVADGTRLDLRGQAVTNVDLGQLDGPAFARVTGVLLARSSVGDAGLAHLRQLGLAELDLYRTAVTDRGLMQLRGMPLERLDLTGTNITDAGLRHLKGLPLEVLVLRDTDITDAGLPALDNLPLVHLDLSFTEITDAGLGSTATLSQLRSLDLSSTAVSDAGLANLEGLPRLAHLTLTGTKVTPRGLQRFQAARPDVATFIEGPTR